MRKKAKIILATGGARSGKSSFALSLGKSSRHPHYIATGWAGDDEMAERIEKHRMERGSRWTTVEERFALSKALESCAEAGADFIIVDCLTVWLSNMMLDGRDWRKELSASLKILSSRNMPSTVFVSNEVGCGIVPGDKLSRDFRDNAGTVNRIVAESAHEVHLCSCGIPVRIK